MGMVRGHPVRPHVEEDQPVLQSHVRAGEERPTPDALALRLVGGGSTRRTCRYHPASSPSPATGDGRKEAEQPVFGGTPNLHKVDRDP